jgi:hypothetical protein
MTPPLHLLVLPPIQPPLGQAIGPFLFWGLLAALIAVIVWAFRRGNRSARAKADPSRVDETRPEAWAEHHRVRWQGSPAAFVADADTWPLGVTAVFGIDAEQPWNTLALANAAPARAGLQEAWGLRTRPQLLVQLAWLLRTGHRAQFAGEIAEATGPQASVATAPAAHSATEEGRELAWRRRAAQANARGIREVDFLAWDLVRAAMLVRAGYSIGWLAEARDTLSFIAGALQQRYRGWAQLGDDFRRARWFWASADGLEARKDDAHDESRQRALLDPASGPWAHLPWSTPLHPCRLLLAQALVDAELDEDADLPADEVGARLAAAIATFAERRAQPL